jgi:ribosome-binding ATPase YchF (GTP1/OBG family)
MLVGIVGKPSCGKSTFFKAATLSEVDIANYPFTTIKPNHAVGFVKVEDPAVPFGKKSIPRFGYVVDKWRFVPVDLIDVAGLVPGAHDGEGMGAQFLSDLNQADVLIHVIDISGSVNARGEACTPLSYDPLNDVTFLEEELDYWYLGILDKSWEKFARQLQQEKQDAAKGIAKQLSGLGVDEAMAKHALHQHNLEGKPVLEWTPDERLALARDFRRRTKPMLLAANKIDVPGADKNFERLKEAYPHYHIVPCSAAAEASLREAAKHDAISYTPGSGEFTIKDATKISEKQAKGLEYIKQNILDKHGSTGVQEVLNHAVFDLLKYKPIYPGGVGKLEDSEGRTLPDCFLMKPETTALDFAFRLHTDFGKHFIKAINVKTKMPVGKDHILEPGSIIEIMAGK